jgi:hypothetical protein
MLADAPRCKAALMAELRLVPGCNLENPTLSMSDAGLVVTWADGCGLSCLLMGQ